MFTIASSLITEDMMTGLSDTIFGMISDFLPTGMLIMGAIVGISLIKKLVKMFT